MSHVFLKGEPVELEKNLPTIGSHLANFSYTTQGLADQDLSFYSGSPLILWFVPSLDTGTCILSAKKLDEHLKKHPHVKALILSMDLPFAQKRVCGLEHLEHVHTGSLFRHQETLTHLGLMISSGPLKGLSTRCCIVIDSHHNITYIDLVKEISDEPNYTELHHHIDRL